MMEFYLVASAIMASTLLLKLILMSLLNPGEIGLALA